MTLGELDKAVAETEGNPWCKPTHGSCCTCQTCGYEHDNCQCGYSESWEMTGPLIEKYKIDLMYMLTGEDEEKWLAALPLREINIEGFGATPLIAVCKALVASKK